MLTEEPVTGSCRMMAILLEPSPRVVFRELRTHHKLSHTDPSLRVLFRASKCYSNN